MNIATIHIISSVARLIPISCAIVLMSGCGLIHIPWQKTLPPSSLRHVMVYDAQTSQPLRDANVVYITSRHVNWFNETYIPSWLFAAKEDLDKLNQEKPGNQIKVIREGTGEFKVLPKKRICWFHATFPIGLPLGLGLINTWGGTFYISAPQHQTILFSDGIAYCKNSDMKDCFMSDWYPLPDRSFIYINNEGVKVYLPPPIEPWREPGGRKRPGLDDRTADE